MSKINILAGANSSGKSTIIQSILLLKQTLQYGAPERGVTLNGPLLRMGEFNDLRNFDALGRNVGIEFELKPNFSEDSVRWYSKNNAHRFVNNLDEVTSLNSSIQLSEELEDGENLGRRSKLKLHRSRLHIQFEGNDESETQSIEVAPVENVQIGLGLEKGQPYLANLDPISKKQLETTRPSLEIVGVAPRHFLPDYLLLKYDRAAQEAKELAAYLCSSHATTLISHQLGEKKVPVTVVKALNQWLTTQKAMSIDESEPLPASEIRHRIAPILYGATVNAWSRYLHRSDKSRTNEAVLNGILNDALLAETQSKYIYDIDMPRTMRDATDYLRQYFKDGIRYLGPLRDAPRPVYPLEALESTTDVGYRGEHTAAVFQLNSNDFLRTHLPPSDTFEDDYFSTAKQTNLSLHDATVAWLIYLGVADDVRATDSGVFGNRLQVANGNLNRLHDLTNVGVGVSQVLPLVVTALLAPVGSLLIFEQPELHLHPRVQARLADFFIALSLDNKQMLLETHSEYLIDRLRLRIALAEDSERTHDVNIMFTEKVGEQSRVIPIEVSEYGAISNWPKDFFDQSQKDISRLLKAASQKRAKAAKRK